MAWSSRPMQVCTDFCPPLSRGMLLQCHCQHCLLFHCMQATAGLPHVVVLYSACLAACYKTVSLSSLAIDTCKQCCLAHVAICSHFALPKLLHGQPPRNMLHCYMTDTPYSSSTSVQTGHAMHGQRLALIEQMLATNLSQQHRKTIGILDTLTSLWLGHTNRNAQACYLGTTICLHAS